jgi:toxin ParE1/3/4
MTTRRIEVRYRHEAVSDLEGIFRSVLRHSKSPTVAAGFVARIRDRCQRIGILPRAGRRRDDLAVGLRTVPFERRTVIAYRVVDDVVEITNIFYGGRDYEAMFRRGELPG